MPRRDRLDIVIDILTALRGRRLKYTHLLYKSNLSYDRLKSYLTDLTEQELIVLEDTKEGPRYSITDKGLVFLQQYASMAELIESLGFRDRK